jgi:hypothetical protein
MVYRQEDSLSQLRKEAITFLEGGWPNIPISLKTPEIGIASPHLSLAP